MIKVKINTSTGFGKTAEFAGIELMQYDLRTKNASVALSLYESVTSQTYILSRLVYLTAVDLENWGLDDMVLVDTVLEKEGFERDLTYVEPTTTTTLLVGPVDPESTSTTTTEPEATTTTTSEPEATTTTTQIEG